MSGSGVRGPGVRDPGEPNDFEGRKPSVPLFLSSCRYSSTVSGLISYSGTIWPIVSETYSLPFSGTCTECGTDLVGQSLAMCVRCSRPFCGEHVVVRRGDATCVSCHGRQKELESTLDADDMRLVRLISHDVAATVGDSFDDVIVEVAARIRSLGFTLEDYRQKVVDEVQQYMHEAHIDTTWPACPMHQNHPLWMTDGWWRCERTGVPIAELGALQPGGGAGSE